MWEIVFSGADYAGGTAWAETHPFTVENTRFEYKLRVYGTTYNDTTSNQVALHFKQNNVVKNTVQEFLKHTNSTSTAQNHDYEIPIVVPDGEYSLNLWCGAAAFMSTSVAFQFSRQLKNAAPTISVTSPVANVTLHENSTLTMAGNASDVDIDDVVTIKYQIDSGTVRNLYSAVSDGTTPIAFTKSLTYKDGVLKDGNTVITGTLDKDMPHTVTMWAEDGKGGSSTPVTRSFFVVPNRPPTITVNPIATHSELINSNVINITGAVSDLDANDVTLTFSINGGTEQQIYSGPPSSFTFNILLNDLRTGANTVVLKAKDIYDSQATKTLTINKTHNAVPVNKAVARYAIQAPAGSAKSILLWIRRTLGSMAITAEVSFTDINEPENYVPLTETNTAVVNGLREEEYAYQGTTDKEKIILKITYDRTDETVLDTIKQISGVLF